MQRRQISHLLILILVLGLGGVLLHSNGKDAVSIGAEKKDSILTAEQISVSFQQVGGRVVSVSAREGQFVRQGAVLMQLDTRDIELQIEKLIIQMLGMDVQIEQAKASLGNQDVNRQQYAVQLAQENLENAQNYCQRMEALYNAGACSLAMLEEAQLKVSSAENAVKQNQEMLIKYQSGLDAARLNVTILEGQKKALEVQLQSLNDQKERMILKAPQDGTILRVIPKLGENVAANAPALLLQSNSLYFDLYVPETQVNNFQTGKVVNVYVVSLNKTVPGLVRFVASAPQYTSMRMSRDNAQGDLSTFQVRIDLNQDAEELLAGMTVEVKTDESI